MEIIDIRKTIRRHPTKKIVYRKETDISSIAVHHSLTTSGSPQAFANYHIDTLGWHSMGYHYVIMRDGTIYWCSDHNVMTYHVGNSNRQALGICMVGDFRRGKQKPTDAQYESLLWLINYLKNTLPNKDLKILGHQEYPGYAWKDCPTTASDVKAFMDKIRKDVINYMKKKEESRTLKLLKEYMYDMLTDNLKELYDNGTLNSLEWYEKAKEKKLTVDELAWLNNVIMTRHIRDVKGGK